MKLIRTIVNRLPQVAAILTVVLLVGIAGGMATRSASTWLEGNETISSSEQAVPSGDSEQQPSCTLASFNEAVIPIVKIQIVFFCSFFQELDLVEEDKAITATDTPLPPNRFFLTLFRQIISPNAP